MAELADFKEYPKVVLAVPKYGAVMLTVRGMNLVTARTGRDYGWGMVVNRVSVRAEINFKRDETGTWTPCNLGALNDEHRMPVPVSRVTDKKTAMVIAETVIPWLQREDSIPTMREAEAVLAHNTILVLADQAREAEKIAIQKHAEVQELWKQIHAQVDRRAEYSKPLPPVS